MKKRFLALSAAAAVGGLGLATSAQAVYYFGPGSHTQVHTVGAATGLELNPGATGHNLIVPYYTAQGSASTFINIVNTDATNGKAVKVRFRGAANTDDVLDFTLFLSPGDVWSGEISQNAEGVAQLNSSSDNSCTLPAGPISGQPFITQRFPAAWSAADKAENTREGYVEILNMADIPPRLTDGAAPNPLYTATKHNTNGTPPCYANAPAPFNRLLTTANAGDGTVALDTYGLEAPTGGLTGGWIILNQQTLTQYSGNVTAVRAYAAAATGPQGPATTGATGPATGATGYGNIAFSPQVEGDYTSTVSPITKVTADPLLTGSTNPARAVTPAYPLQWYDVPDLSTPLTTVWTTPTEHANALAWALGKTSINNEFINATGAVPMSTDWVVSQPTRRYFAAVSYTGSSTGGPLIVYNDGNTSGPARNVLPYVGGLTLGGFRGSVACLSDFKFAEQHDREEAAPPPPAAAGATFSPGVGGPAAPAVPLCGEVATLTWGTSPLGTHVTNFPVTSPYTTGWARYDVPGVGAGGAPYGLPIIGFAAESASNGTTGRSFGAAFPFRW